MYNKNGHGECFSENKSNAGILGETHKKNNRHTVEAGAGDHVSGNTR